MEFPTRTAVCIKPNITQCALVFLILFTVATIFYQWSYDGRYKFTLFDSKNDQVAVQNYSLSLAADSQPQAKHGILLVTYGRSGSSFTSALIAHDPNVLFFFEPLHILGLPGSLGIGHNLRNNEIRNSSKAVISAYLSCSFPKEYVFALLNMHSGHTEHAETVKDCLQAERSGVDHVKCFLDFLDVCEDYSTVFIKTIRFKVEWAEEFLENNPNFQLLYLIRDPRATLLSQAVTFRAFKWRKEEIYNVSKEHCSAVASDLAAAERLKRRYPDRVKGIRYEEGALDPYDYTKEIYHFLGLSYNESVAEYIDILTNHTAQQSEIEEPYEVFRENSAKTMNKWRIRVVYDNVKIIDENCRHLYSKMGYKAVESKDQLESDSSLVIDPEPESVFS